MERVQTDATPGARRARASGRGVRRGRPALLIGGAVLVSLIAAIGPWDRSVSGRGEVAAGEHPADVRTERPRSTAPTTTQPSPGSSTSVPVPVPVSAPVEVAATATAPLTGRTVRVESLMRPALVSKIDATPEAMPQVGLEVADVVYEAKVEWGSRYIAVWHSQLPPVVGPQRSARTTDPDLLAMFGHPLFAYSGANPGVIQALEWSSWETGVGPGQVPGAYFRDDSRPFPHNLFARTDDLLAVPNPQVYPSPLFTYHAPGSAAGGVPVSSFASNPGLRCEFFWDPALGGWRRRVWNQEHLDPNGQPLAPTNVVVVETAYAQSWADANSPEAISVGWGRAWVFSDGTMREGTWRRDQRTDPWNLTDLAGAALTLTPGSTWVVLSEGEPEIHG